MWLLVFFNLLSRLCSNVGRGLKQEQKRTNRIITHRHVARIALPNFSIVTERFGVQLVAFQCSYSKHRNRRRTWKLLGCLSAFHFWHGFEKEWHNITAVFLPVCVCERELDTYRQPYMIWPPSLLKNTGSFSPPQMILSLPNWKCQRLLQRVKRAVWN